MARCAGCKQSISGRYIQAQKKNWHPACFRCQGCGLPLDGPYVDGAKSPWHASCFRAAVAKTCAGCGEMIQGTTITALDQHWHPHCFCCGHCNKPIQQTRFHTKDGKGYHPNCYKRAFVPPCAVCADPLTQRFIIDDWDNRYCDFHPKQMPLCFGCNILISDGLSRGGQRLKDGRNLCSRCLQNAVMHQDEAQRMLTEVRSTMESMGFDFAGAHIPFRLVTPAELQQRAKSKKRKAERPTLGMARTTTVMRGKQVVDRRFDEIIIMDSLPEEHFRVVAAHELCHAWLFIKAFRNLPDRVEEGLCSLAEALWLERQKTEMAGIRLKRLAKNPDPIYGGGYRAARKALQKMTVGKLLMFVRKHKRFPGDGLVSRLFGS